MMRLCTCLPIALCCFALTIAGDVGIHRIEIYSNGGAKDLKLDSVKKAFDGLGDVSTLAGLGFPKLAPATNILSAIFGLFSLLLGQNPAVESPDLKLLTQKFGEINMQLDTAAEDLDLIKNLIVETSLKAAYIADEDAIVTGFQKLGDFVNYLNNVICADAENCLSQRLQIGETYLPYFDVNQNMDSIYQGAMDNTTTFHEPLLEHIHKTYGCDVPKMNTFNDGIRRLAFQEQQVTMVYSMLSGSTYSLTNTLDNWVNQMYRLEDFSEQLTRQCLSNIKSFIIKDIKDTKYQSTFDSNYDAATAIRDDLLQKYCSPPRLSMPVSKPAP